MTRVRSFPPVAKKDAKFLILGSMPGVRSLQAGQYYAHPHNHFWRIMGELLGAGPDLEYPQRLEKLTKSGVALWDVLAACTRPGSLDSAITQEEPNDFEIFLPVHPHIRHIIFNGQKAHKSFLKHIGKSQVIEGCELIVLPSTSPANASYSYARKLDVWRAALTAK